MAQGHDGADGNTASDPAGGASPPAQDVCLPCMQGYDHWPQEDQDAINKLGKAGRASATGRGGNKGGVKQPQRHTGGGGKPSPGSSKPTCPICKGHHPDLRQCPNDLAKQDKTFQFNSSVTCGHRYGNQPRCEGIGHFARHHKQKWTLENPGKRCRSQLNRAVLEEVRVTARASCEERE